MELNLLGKKPKTLERSVPRHQKEQLSMSYGHSCARALFAITIACSAFSARAATEPLGFEVDISRVPGTQGDEVLSANEIGSIVREVLGKRVTPGRSNRGTVLVEGQQMYVAQLQNLRVLTFSVGIYRSVMVDGQRFNANLCSSSVFTWRAGHSASSAAGLIREAVADHARAFIAQCMK